MKKLKKLINQHQSPGWLIDWLVDIYFILFYFVEYCFRRFWNNFLETPRKVFKEKLDDILTMSYCYRNFSTLILTFCTYFVIDIKAVYKRVPVHSSYFSSSRKSLINFNFISLNSLILYAQWNIVYPLSFFFFPFLYILYECILQV